MDVNIYLTFDGRCAEAFAEYARILGGEVAFEQTYGETPMAEHTPPEQHEPGDAFRAHASATRSSWARTRRRSGTRRRAGSRCRCTSTTSTRGGGSFDALAEGGTVKMPLQETFWAKGFGMLIDRFGTPGSSTVAASGGGDKRPEARNRLYRARNPAIALI